MKSEFQKTLEDALEKIETAINKNGTEATLTEEQKEQLLSFQRKIQEMILEEK